MGTVCVDVDLDMRPMTFDLVFPEGIERGGRLSFNFSRPRLCGGAGSPISNLGVTGGRLSQAAFFDAAYAREKVRVFSGDNPSSFCFIDERCSVQDVPVVDHYVEVQSEGREVEVESEYPSPATSPIPDTEMADSPASERVDSPEPVEAADSATAVTVDTTACAVADGACATTEKAALNEDARFSDHTYVGSKNSEENNAPVVIEDDAATATHLVISDTPKDSTGGGTTVTTKMTNLAPSAAKAPPTTNHAAAAVNSSKENSAPTTKALYSCLYCRHITPCKETAIAHCKIHTARKDPLLKQPLMGAATPNANKAAAPATPDKTKPQRNCMKPRISNVYSLSKDGLSVETADRGQEGEAGLAQDASIETAVLPTVLNMLASMSPNVKRVVLKTGPVPLDKAGSLAPKNITAVVKKTPENSPSPGKPGGSPLAPKSVMAMAKRGVRPLLPTTILPKSITETKRPPVKPPPNAKIVFKCFKCSHVTFDKHVALKHLQEHTSAAQEKQAEKENSHNDEAESVSPPSSSPTPPAPEGPTKRALPLMGSQLKPLIQRPVRPLKNQTESIKYFACTRCRKVYRNKSSLRKHMVKHTGEQKFRCEICDRGFQFKSVLQVHMKVHSRSSQFKCGKCKRGFVSEAALQNHEKKDHTDPVVCHICNLPFLRRHNLVVHMMQRHGQTAQHRCTACRRPFFTEDELAAHKSSCKGDTYRDCAHCSFKGATYRELCDHVVQCHPEAAQFKCDTCGLVSIHKTKNRSHMRTHQPGYRPKKAKHTYKCSQCDKELRSQSGLQSHMSSHNNIRPFTCPICDGKFSSKGSLRTHRINVHGSTTYSCDQCPLTCKSLFALRKHKTLIHAQTIEFQCDQCGKRFTSERKKQLHTAVVHLGDTACLEGGQNPFPLLKVYRCTEAECSYATFSLYRSKAHAITHTGVMPYQCDQCDKSFVVQDELKRHVTLQHNKGKQRPCPHCGRMFVSDTRFEWHLRLHEMNQGFKCSKCSYVYESKAYLEHHQQRHSEESRCICQVCSKPFKTARAMAIHVTHMHPEAAKSPSLQVLRSLRYPHGCDQCPVRFKTTTELRAHKLCRHSPAGVRRPGSVSSGQPERNYGCHFCGKSFRHNCALQTHLRTHTGERPFQCPHCPKAFSIHQTLKDHVVSVHTKQFKLHCLLCGKGVVNNTKLKQHLQHAHKAVPKPTLPLSARGSSKASPPDQAPTPRVLRTAAARKLNYLQPQVVEEQQGQQPLHLAPIVFLQEQGGEDAQQQIAQVYVEQEVVAATTEAMVVEDPIKLLTSFF